MAVREASDRPAPACTRATAAAVVTGGEGVEVGEGVGSEVAAGAVVVAVVVVSALDEECWWAAAAAASWEAEG